MPEIKLIFFDMDNVIFDMGFYEQRKEHSASTWTLLYDYLNARHEDDRMSKKWASGRYRDYSEWAGEAVKVLRNYGLNRERYYNFINKIPLMKGASETFEELRKGGYKTAIITGSFQELAERAQKLLGIDHLITGCSLVFNQRGELEKPDILPCDYGGKLNFGMSLAKGLGLDLDQCAFVFDGVNDLYLADKVALPIPFNTNRKEITKKFDSVIKEKDLTKILTVIKTYEDTSSGQLSRS
ncbi:MAG: HAD family phosphatase [archaeon]|nr:MAG: HAD family phosphatase [archaeon]